MRKFGIPTVMIAFAMVSAAGTANAQIATPLKPVQLGVALGGAIPLTALGKNFNTGYNLTGTIGINPAGMPVGFRIDAAYNQFGAKGTTNVNAKIAGVSGNVVLSMTGEEMTPYLIGGVGYYRVSSSATGSVDFRERRIHELRSGYYRRDVLDLKNDPRRLSSSCHKFEKSEGNAS